MARQPANTESDALVRRLFRQSAVTMVILAAVMFISAGTIAWPEAWFYLVWSGVLGVGSAYIIAQRNPGLMRERMRGPIQKGQKDWDKRLLVVVLALCVAMPVVAGLQVRFGTAHMPIWLEVVGAACVALGIYTFHVVMETNTYASAVVRIQSERGHQVISTGPYAFVRHPMYAGALLYFIGMGLMLGSWYATAIGAVVSALFGVRAVWEEETLKQELAGYAAYAERVRYRLIPGVW